MDATYSKSRANNGHESNDGDGSTPTPGEAVNQAKQHFSELFAYVGQYMTAKIGGVKTSVRNLVIYAILGVLGLIAGGAMIVTAASIVVLGLAEAVGRLLGGRMWAGNLIVGLLLLAAIAVTAMMVIKKLFHSSRQATVKEHERRLKQQRVTLRGHDARQRSAEYIAEQRQY